MKMRIAILAVVMLLAIALVLPACDAVRKTPDDGMEFVAVPTVPQVTDGNGKEIDVDAVTELPEVVVFRAAPASSEDEYIGVTVSASVFPVSAGLDGLSWEAEWANAENTAPMDTYFRIIPEGDGSFIASFRCYAPFEDDITVTISTRGANVYSTKCTVRFRGLPTRLAIDMGDLYHSVDKTWADIGTFDVYEIPTAQSDYLFKISFDNEIHCIDPDFVPDLAIELSFRGAFIATERTVFNDGETEEKEITLLLDSERNIPGLFKYKIYDSMFKASLTGDELSIRVSRSIRRWTFEEVRNSGTVRTTLRFKEPWEGRNPFTTIKITEKYTGISTEFHFTTDIKVKSVGLNRESIIF